MESGGHEDVGVQARRSYIQDVAERCSSSEGGRGGGREGNTRRVWVGKGRFKKGAVLSFDETP